MSDTNVYKRLQGEIVLPIIKWKKTAENVC
jgi:hypothetical protein